MNLGVRDEKRKQKANLDGHMTTLNESPTASDCRDVPPPSRFDRADFDVILEPRLGWRAVDFAELYRSRDPFVYWTLRNLKARHAQSATSRPRSRLALSDASSARS